MWDLKARQQRASPSLLLWASLMHYYLYCCEEGPILSMNAFAFLVVHPVIAFYSSLFTRAEPYDKTYEKKTKFKPYHETTILFFFVSLDHSSGSTSTKHVYDAAIAAALDLGTHMHDRSLSLSRINITI